MTLNQLVDDQIPMLEDFFAEDQAYESSHTKRQVKLSEKWEKSNPEAFKAFVEGAMMRNGVVCTNCGAPPCARCRQCGPHAFFVLTVLQDFI